MAILKTLTLLITLTVLIQIAAALGGRIVGGRTTIENVKSNQEIQDLGKFSVNEYNHQNRKKNSFSLVFKEVIEAESQVVNGLKYYLKISASQGGSKKLFDSVVVVRPWERSKKLIGFSPSKN